MEGTRKRARWRDYKTAAGNRPVKDFIDRLSDEDTAQVVAAMKEVADLGLAAARHLRGDVYEIRANSDRRAYRILFAAEGRYSHILLALVGFTKKTQKTPLDAIFLAEQRLSDWRRRGRPRTNK